MTPSWSWEDCMREFINHPIYRAIATGTERKNIFIKFVDEKRKAEEDEKARNLVRFREEFKQLVLSTKEVISATHFKKFCDINSRHPSFRAIETEKEREQLFKQAIEEKFRKQKDEERNKRKRGIEKFQKLLAGLSEITYCTKWKEAQEIYRAHKIFQQTSEFKELDPIDFLITFEDYIKNLERKHISEKQTEKEKQRRMERKNRESFDKILRELKDDGKITAKTKWKEIFPLIKDSECFLNMVGQPGSQPIDLFFDLVSELNQKLEKKRSNFKNLIRKLKYITVDSTWEEIKKRISDEEAFKDFDNEEMKIEIFQKRVKYIREKLEREKEKETNEEVEEGEVKPGEDSRRYKRSRSRSKSRRRRSRRRSRTRSRSRKRADSVSRSRSRDYSYRRRTRKRSASLSRSRSRSSRIRK